MGSGGGWRDEEEETGSKDESAVLLVMTGF